MMNCVSLNCKGLNRLISQSGNWDEETRLLAMQQRS